MKLIAKWHKHTLNFSFPAGTSRGVLTERDVWYIKLSHESHPSAFGLGECAPLKGLSIDDREDFNEILDTVCHSIQRTSHWEDIPTLCPEGFPSIRMGIEMAMADLARGGKRQYFDNEFSAQGGKIPINGLIWMGSKDFMLQQIEKKIDSGFSVLKLKIGAIDFATECDILESIRKKYSTKQLEIRVDANGAFPYMDALDKLTVLSEFDLHSIEQPLAAGQPELMKKICEKSLVPVALDEELIGIHSYEGKIALLNKVKPAYIILKPTLLGGFAATKEWISVANQLHIGWWMTSALESTIGLNAIAQFTAEYFPLTLPQGLGTGQLYTNNITGPISIDQGNYIYQASGAWELPADILHL
ncbi:MAG: o-succinylbenzoate synthase [Cytophagales bacterium]|nr:o-succinylbenzoate synthase [Cytophagales bacterium]